MAPLSRQLSALILPHEHFGSHLNSERKTTDVELEKQNFKYSGETLAEFFSNLTIDNCETFSEFIDSEQSEIDKKYR